MRCAAAIVMPCVTLSHVMMLRRVGTLSCPFSTVGPFFPMYGCTIAAGVAIAS
jgi:hypothetical protein